MQRFDPISYWLRGLPLRAKIFFVAGIDLVGLSSMVLLAYAMRVSSLTLPHLDLLPLYVLAPAISVASAFLFDVYNASARNFSLNVERRILLSQILVPAAWFTVVLTSGEIGFARSVVLIYPAFAVLFMIAIRRGAAFLLGSVTQDSLPTRDQVPLLIYGAGRDGLAVLEALRRQGRYKPVAFVDTDYTLVQRVVGGLQVYSTENLDDLIKRHAPREVVIAKNSHNRAQRRILVDRFLDHGLKVKIVPGLDDIVDGRYSLSDVRPVRVEDLLGRDPVPPDRVLMDSIVKGKVVLITGAGGSIGSELTRQVAALSPKSVVLLDHSEFSLFQIHREIENAMLATGGTPFALEPVLADVQNAALIDNIVARVKPDLILHAAAYKHVRMVQENASAGVCNNVMGTKNVAEAALLHGVARCVLISTDKAVRPTSIMGASKRLAEMLLQAMAAEGKGKTVFSMVRFGNVLGSTGSVVPIFQEQIAAGGPVLVTHPEVTRYFMLITEAAQLVIQAGAMAEGGEVFVLDMGESIKIVQLAETMIELAGLSRKSEQNPDGDIEIKFIGLREGEKLYEELQIGRDISNTKHPRIMRSRETFLPSKKIEAELKKIFPAGHTQAIAVNTKILFDVAMLS